MLENDGEMREVIVLSAQRVFGAKGTRAATLEDVANAAGITQSELCSVFQSKDELYLVAATRAARTYQDVVRQACEPFESSTGFEQISAGVSAGVQFAREMREVFRLAVMSEGMDYPVDDSHALFPEYRAAMGAIAEYGMRILSKGQADGSIRRDLSDSELLMLLWSGITGLLQLDALNSPASGPRLRTRSDETKEAITWLLGTLRPATTQAP
jgi:AcrR family transcriptional regulator